MSKTITITPDVLPALPDNFGQQLTEQYHRAVGGMKEILIFGAMMWKVKETVAVNAGVQVRTPGGTFKGGDGLKAWIEKNAPKIDRTTAYRFFHVVEAIAKEYEAIVGARIAKQFALPDLVTTPAAELPDAARAKQLELFDYVSGTSQRSWLDRFKPPASRGGDNGGRRGKPKSPEELKRELQERCNALWDGLHVMRREKFYHVLDVVELNNAETILDELLRDVRAWKRLSQAERRELLGKELLALADR